MQPTEPDFRPPLLERDDSAFLGAMSLTGSLAVALLIFVWTAPAPAAVQLVRPSAAVQHLLQQPVVLVEEPPEVEFIAEAVNEPIIDTPDPQDAPGDGSADPNELPDAGAQAPGRSLSLWTLGTTGDSDATAQLFDPSDRALEDLQAALDAVDGVGEEASTEPLGLRAGEGVANDDVDIADLRRLRGGPTEVAPVAPVQVTSTFRLVEPAAPTSSDPGSWEAIIAAVRDQSPQLQSCYERSLARDPTLEGRIEAVWNVHAGRVTQVELLINTTRNSELGDCVTTRIRRWRFPAGVEGEVSLPFAFAPAH